VNGAAEADDGVAWPALAALSHGDRDLLLLRGWDGLGVTEIAAALAATAAVGAGVVLIRRRARRRPESC
jgi:DNA-directed RNA polymerase specialized sigma24 family protein